MRLLRLLIACLVLALAVVPAPDAAATRADVVQVAADAPIAARVQRSVTPARVVFEPRASIRSELARPPTWPAACAPALDERRLYLTNCTFLC